MDGLARLGAQLMEEVAPGGSSLHLRVEGEGGAPTGAHLPHHSYLFPQNKAYSNNLIT